MPYFSSGPCAKPQGWDAAAFESVRNTRALLGPFGHAHLTDLLYKLRLALRVPTVHRIVLVPGSATGAIEAALWNLLGQNPVAVQTLGTFGERWADDAEHELGLKTTRVKNGAWPEKHDCVVTWCETASGWWMGPGPHANLPESEFMICDATSAAFVADLPWERFDATAFSFQKALGGEGGLGVLVLGPRAYDRLCSWTPPWPVPRLLRLKRRQADGTFAVLHSVLEATLTLSTFSWLTVLDAAQCLELFLRRGGLTAAQAVCKAHQRRLEAFVSAHPSVKFLQSDSAHRSWTVSCLRLEGVDVQSLQNYLEQEKAAFDVGSHPSVGDGLRFWTGPTVPVGALEHALHGIGVFLKENG